jgi:2'-5' RNA ligase
MPRLFTGIEIPEDVAAALSLHRGGLAGARWIEPSDYHLTLRFLGDVDNRTAREIAEALDGVRGWAFDVGIDGLGSFGGDRPRSVHAEIAPNPALTDLQEEHERAARRAGLPPESRKFTPHVTLARLRGVSAAAVAEWLAMQGRIARVELPVERFVLFSARASVGGGPFVVEEFYPLGGG